jgi:hypothetical protein
VRFGASVGRSTGPFGRWPRPQTSSSGRRQGGFALPGRGRRSCTATAGVGQRARAIAYAGSHVGAFGTFLPSAAVIWNPMCAPRSVRDQPAIQSHRLPSKLTAACAVSHSFNRDPGLRPEGNGGAGGKDGKLGLGFGAEVSVRRAAVGQLRSSAPSRRGSIGRRCIRLARIASNAPSRPRLTIGRSRSRACNAALRPGASAGLLGVDGCRVKASLPSAQRWPARFRPAKFGIRIAPAPRACSRAPGRACAGLSASSSVSLAAPGVLRPPA